MPGVPPLGAASWLAFHAIADDSVPHLSKAFVTAVQLAIKAATKNQDKLLSHLIAGNTKAAGALVQTAWHAGTSSFKKSSTDIFTMVSDAVFKKAVTPHLGVDFTTMNPRAHAWAQQHAGQMITLMDKHQRSTTRQIIADGFRHGLTRRDMSRRLIHEGLGLHARQASTLGNYRSQLEASGLNKETVIRKVQRRRDRMTRQRSEMIARTETMRASNMGVQLALEERVAKGALDPAYARKIWIVTADDRTCPYCLAIDGQLQPIHQPFVSLTHGSVMVPPLHPMCRCAMADPPPQSQPRRRPVTAKDRREHAKRENILKKQWSDVAHYANMVRRDPRAILQLRRDPRAWAALYVVFPEKLVAYGAYRLLRKHLSRYQYFAKKFDYIDAKAATVLDVLRGWTPDFLKSKKPVPPQVMAEWQKMQKVTRTVADDLYEEVVAEFGKLARGEGDQKRIDKLLFKNLESYSAADKAMVRAKFRGLWPADKSKITTQMRDGFSDFLGMTDPDLVRKMPPVRYGGYSQRPYARFVQEKGEVYAEIFFDHTRISGKDFAHELGHVLEQAEPKLFREAAEFIEKNTVATRSQIRPDLPGEVAFLPKHRSAFGAFVDTDIGRYMAKIYDDHMEPAFMATQSIHGTKVMGTELVSVGLELMYRNPQALHEQAPELFKFIFTRVMNRSAACAV